MADADAAGLPEDPFGWVNATLKKGTYFVERVEAHGGFAIVYRARDLTLGRPVAVKCLKPERMGTGPTWKADFLREANVLQDLSTANSAIVQAYGADVERSPRGGESVFLILEWLEGRTLERDIAERGGRPLAEAVALLAPVAEGLALAHARGIVHLDLKPSNLYVVDHDRSPRLKILDFGIAKAMSRMTEGARPDAPTVVTGTAPRFLSPPYAAPEQFEVERGDPGPQTDVYALALVLIAVVEGREPYAGLTREKIRREALDSANRPSFAASTPISKAVRRVMRTALAVEPRNRYGDAREFWTELTKALRGEVRAPVRGETEPVSVPEPRVAAPPTQSKSQAESATATTSPVTATPEGPSPRRRSRFYWTVAALVLVAAAVPLRGFLATDTALSDAHRLESALSGGDAHQVAALYAEQALVFENTWDRTQIEKWAKDWWRDNPDTSVRFTSCRSAWRFENSELAACDGVLTRHGKPISFTECQMWSDDGLLQLRENAGAGGCTDGSTWSTRCYLYIKQRRYRWAQIACDEAFRANPASEETRARLLNNAGMLACALGQVPEAAKRFRESLDLRPKDDTDRRTVQAALDALPRCLLP